MNKIIYYFSGTGNSLYIAKAISSQLKCSYRSMAQYMKDGNKSGGIDQIIIAFPMYNHSYPLIVQRFFEMLSDELSLCEVHISAVCTYGNDLGITLLQLDKLIRSLGGSLSLGFGINMPYNYVEPIGFRLRGLLDSFVLKEHVPSEIQKANEKAILRVKEIVPLIQNKYKVKLEARSVFIESLVDKLGLQDTIQKKVWAKVAGTYTSKDESFYDMVKHMDEGFSVNVACTKCGLCSSVCPVDNITMGLDGKPEFNHNCEQCFACISWCPSHAINFRNTTVGRRRYHNIGVSITEIVDA